MRLLHPGCGVILALLACLACGTAWGQNTPAGDSANGRRIYLAVGCFACHGRSGQGGAYNYPAPALAQLQWPLDALRAFVRAGPKDMPAYSEAVLSDAQLGDIYAFLRSLPGQRPAKDIPLLNQ